jgi:CRISPR/Cas system CSM-associated protein Csm4 (group 5 of RAMP superfamily)
LTNEERKTQKKLREMAREEKDRGERVKIGYRKLQINGEWFIWDEREKKLKKNLRRRREEEKMNRREKV